MSLKKTLAAAIVLAFAAGYAASALQETGKKPAQDPAEMMQAMLPKPGPDHARLKMLEGTWDGEIEMAGMPGAPPTKSKCTEIYRAIADGLWLVHDYEGEMMGMAFQGHGIAGFDPGKKKIVGAWVDSWSSGLATYEGSYDEKTKTQTSVIEGPDMTGKVTKSTMVDRWSDDDHRVWTMSMPGPDGKEAEGFKITYRRRK